jgi:hypothetical protein
MSRRSIVQFLTGRTRWNGFAFLALFSQLAISLVPMPVLAADGMPICQFAEATPAHGGDHAPAHHATFCPVCHAVQLLGSLVPPTPAALPSAIAVVSTAGFVAVERAVPSRPATNHRARAPPPSV